MALVFSKKSLFSADIEKRCAGAKLLVMLLGTCGKGVDGTEEEVLGYLKRCLTQQREVRWNVYAAVCSALEGEGNAAVAQSMERLILGQLDRILEIEELEDVREARRARASGSR